MIDDMFVYVGTWHTPSDHAYPAFLDVGDGADLPPGVPMYASRAMAKHAARRAWEHPKRAPIAPSAISGEK